jgi:protein ImuB
VPGRGHAPVAQRAAHGGDEGIESIEGAGLAGAGLGETGAGAAGAVASALRLLDPPEPADAACDDDGAPVRVRWRERALVVAHADGPERLSGEWWAYPYRRDYWRAATDAGLLLLYRDRTSRGWYVQGWYD